ncbi:YceD family protein [Saezia sanguinis]|uniref:YceD family protein n=1 Tax=Saezia sanguinis TaxID=1965230 RepID=UPI003031D725
MKTPLSVRKLNVAEFARREEELTGSLSLDDMPRLADLCVAPLPAGITSSTPIAHWRARGEFKPQRIGEPQLWLFLTLEAQIPLRCQRCLQDLLQLVPLELSYRFVATEEQATLEDGESEEEVLSLTRALDLPALCEDELIMALPLIPLHEICPDPLVPGLDRAGMMLEISDDDEQPNVQNGEEAEKPNPFAALETLRKKLH